MVRLSKLEKNYLEEMVECDHQGYFQQRRGNLHLIRKPFDLFFKLKSFNNRGEIKKGKVAVDNQGSLASVKFSNPVEPKKPIKCDVKLLKQEEILYISKTQKQINVLFKNPIEGNFVLEYTII